MENNELALWRYALIAPLLHRAPEISVTAMAQQLAAEVKYRPDGQSMLLSAPTLLRWLRRYQAGRLQALSNQPRSDRGQPRALDQAAIAMLRELLAQHQDWTTKAIHRNAQQQLGRALPVKSVYRLLKGHRRTLTAETFRHRPVGIPQVLWLADTMHAVPVYGPHRKKQKTYLIVLFDDASRAVMAGRFSLHDNVSTLIPLLREAILARGLPHRLLVDNGPSYRSRVLRTACAQLGIHLIYATPYHPTSKARLERFFLTVRLQLIPQLPPYPSLQDLNTAWARFLNQYHSSPHSTLSEITNKPTSPLDYYLRFLPDVEHVTELAVADLFLLEETRRVQADGIIRVAARVFEVTPELACSRVTIRFNPEQPLRVLYRPANKPAAPFIQAFPVA